MDFTPEQLEQLKALGLAPPSTSTPSPSPETISQPHQSLSNSPENDTIYNKYTQDNAPKTGEIPVQTISSNQAPLLLTTPKLPVPSRKSVIPLLSISGLTLLSFGGIVLLKTKAPSVAGTTTSNLQSQSPDALPTPTQVPKSIQHFLLTSQQYFSQALQAQAGYASTSSSSGHSAPDQAQLVNLINQSILAASDAIKQFPSDYRGFRQRGRIYQSLLDSQPQLIDQAIADYTQASALNPSDSATTHDLATLYARKGDAANAITYLSKTIAIDPTVAQNFYDLAHLETQSGMIPQALDTYNRLLPLISDASQRQQVEKETADLQNLTKQVAGQKLPAVPTPANTVARPTIKFDSPAIQADAGTGLVIAAPQDVQTVEVTNLTDSNSLSGTATLPAGQKSLTIKNSHVTSASQVYLTVTKGGKNLTLQVLSKSPGTFEAGLDAAASENIDFKWWIID